MSIAGKIAILIIVILFAALGYACLLAAHTSDAEAERMYQDYLKYKANKKKH